MTLQKFVRYNSLDTNGTTLKEEYTLELKVNEKSGNYLIHKDLVRHLNSLKQGTSSTKTRSEVRGGGRKPWRQKGTGRARAGSNRSPLWKGGGVTFGPKLKKVHLKINKKERKLTLQTLLYNKRNIITIINNLETIDNSPKTHKFIDICNKCKIKLNQEILLIVFKKTPFLELSTRNLKNVTLISVYNLNTLNLLKAKEILLTPLALEKIKEIYCE